MSRLRNQHHKAFLQCQPEPREREGRKRIEATSILEDLALRYRCSTAVSNEFANQCLNRLDDLAFDMKCSRIALEFWSEPTHSPAPVTDALRKIVAEHERHANALIELHQRLTDLMENPAMHQHLGLPITYYETQLRIRLLADAEIPLTETDMTPTDS